jgi:hypothetical protein
MPFIRLEAGEKKQNFTNPLSPGLFLFRQNGAVRLDAACLDFGKKWVV